MCIFNFLLDQGTTMFFWKEKQNFCIVPANNTCSKSTIESSSRVLIVNLNIFYLFFYCYERWLWEWNVSRNCKNFLYCRHQIKLQQQLKLLTVLYYEFFFSLWKGTFLTFLALCFFPVMNFWSCGKKYPWNVPNKEFLWLGNFVRNLNLFY